VRRAETGQKDLGGQKVQLTLEQIFVPRQGPAASNSELEFLSVDAIGAQLSSSLEVIRETSTKFPSVPWEIGFSGGKDSSVVCHLVFEYVRQAMVDGSPTPPKLYILYSDTLLDVPILRRHTLSTLQSMKEYSKKFGELFEIKITKPKQGRDYFSMVIEKGYSAPHFRYRWCIDRLKMAPSVDFLKGVGKYCMFTGVRQDESPSRRRNMAQRLQTEPIVEVDGVPLIAPLMRWSQQDIWLFLSLFRQPWNGEKYDSLFEIYRLGDNLEGCGQCALTPNSRFGCWVCTVVRKDRLLRNLATYSEEYKVMLDAKERIRRISLTPRLREYNSEGRYTGLNLEGRKQVVNVLADVIIQCKGAIEAYVEDEDLRQKLKHWFDATYKSDGNPMLKVALEILETYKC
jgi:DNA sulfur modification protein DndC